MPTEIICPACGRKGKLPDTYANRVVRCAQCHETFQASVLNGNSDSGNDAGPETNQSGEKQGRRPASSPHEPQDLLTGAMGPSNNLSSGPSQPRRKSLLFWGMLGSGIALPLLLVMFFMGPGSRNSQRELRPAGGNGAEGQPAAGKGDQENAPQQGQRGRRGKGRRKGRNKDLPAAVAPQGPGQNERAIS
jgi:hypothetical protein